MFHTQLFCCVPLMSFTGFTAHPSQGFTVHFSHLAVQLCPTVGLHTQLICCVPLLSFTRFYCPFFTLSCSAVPLLYSLWSTVYPSHSADQLCPTVVLFMEHCLPFTLSCSAVPLLASLWSTAYPSHSADQLCSTVVLFMEHCLPFTLSSLAVPLLYSLWSTVYPSHSADLLSHCCTLYGALPTLHTRLICCVPLLSFTRFHCPFFTLSCSAVPLLASLWSTAYPSHSAVLPCLAVGLHGEHCAVLCVCSTLVHLNAKIR